MLISKQKLKNIIAGQLQHLIKESDEISHVYDINKQLLICADYYKKIIDKIINNNIKNDVNRGKLLQQSIDKLIQSDAYINIYNRLNSIHIENPIPTGGEGQDYNPKLDKTLAVGINKKKEYQLHGSVKLLNQIHNLFNIFVNTKFNPNEDPYHTAMNGVRTPNISNIGQFITKLDQYNRLLPDIINNTQKEIAMLSNQITNVTQDTNIPNRQFNSQLDPDVLHAISQLESISNTYFEQIEVLFQNIVSIGHDIANNTKDASEYDLLKPRGMITKTIKDEEDLMNDPNDPKSNYNSPIKNSKLYKQYGHFGPLPKNKFNKGVFLNALYKKEFPAIDKKSEYDEEKYKAKTINTVVEKLDKLDKNIKKLLPQIHDALWNDEQQQYTAQEDILSIFQNMKNAKKHYKELMFIFLNTLDKKDTEIEHYFKNETYKFEAFIKLMQFYRINNKQIFLDIIHNRPRKDVAYDAEQYSQEQQAKIKERLMYWNLFKRLGWLKGKEEVPSWLYGIKG